ncbi:cupin domain-containing protein [Glycomyces arizonensis]|uniref:cupin domain-containing protein n=1 Tax=Glycomyces arizonensis TaxID=256035 RepID=UPI00047C482A|nr:cupin domain-containing protein [Glycomyces arizonensis]
MDLNARSFEAPDDSRPFEHGHVEVVVLEGRAVSRMTFEPGWQWSEHVRPLVGTESCQVAHVGYLLRGRLAVRMDNGTEAVAGPGQVVIVPPGHDGWVVGAEECVMLDWGGDDYAPTAGLTRT